MKNKFTAFFIPAIVLLTILISPVFGNDDSLNKIDIKGKFMYPQIGFWEEAVKFEGIDETFYISDNSIKDLLRSNEKGRQYYDSFTFRRGLGFAITGGGFVLFGTLYCLSIKEAVTGHDSSAEALFSWSYSGLIIALAGDIFAVYAKDDLYLSINEFNRNQLKDTHASVDREILLSKNFKF